MESKFLWMLSTKLRSRALNNEPSRRKIVMVGSKPAHLSTTVFDQTRKTRPENP
jgi:hypothetical protein